MPPQPPTPGFRPGPTCGRARFSRAAGLWALCLAAVGCEAPANHAGKGALPSDSLPLTGPSEAVLSSTEDPAVWIRRGETLEAGKRPVEALVAYRNAMRLLPRDWPADRRSALEGKIARLSFLMGVPGQVERPPDTPRPASPRNPSAVAEARTFFQQARTLEAQGEKAEAMALYRKVLGTIDDKDDRDLYWHAWQRLDDLSPPGQGPGDGEAGPQTSSGTKGSPGPDGARAPRPPRRHGDRSDADMRLLNARKAYVQGMGAVDAENREAAREAFQTVIDLIDEDQDPALYRAAKANLRVMSSQAAPTPNPFLGY